MRLHNVLMQNAQVLRLTAALEAAARMLRAASVAGDLSLSASSVLGRLLIEGPQRLTSLAVAERVSQPAMTQLVARLERDKLVRKRADTLDARAVLVEITAAGRRLVEQRRQERADFIGGMLSRLDDAATAELAAALPALEMLVRAHQPDVVPRQAAEVLA